MDPWCNVLTSEAIRLTFSADLLRVGATLRFSLFVDEVEDPRL